MTSVTALQAAAVRPRSVAHLASRIAAGGMWQMSGQAATLAATLLATPIVIRLLGAEAYGVLALINVILGFSAVGDFGMGTAAKRFGALAYARRDEDGEREAVWTALVIGLAFGAVLACVLWISSPWLVDLLRVPDGLRGSAIWAFRLSAIAMLARFAASSLNTPQLVRLRFGSNALINAATGIAQILIAPVVLLFGGGLAALSGAIAAFAVMNAYAHGLVSSNLAPKMSVPAVSRRLAPTLLRFGGGIVVSYGLILILIHAEKVIITRFNSVTALAYYAVAATLATSLQMLPIAVGQNLIPAFSHLQHTSDQERRLYVGAVRAVLLGMMPLAFMLAVGGESFLRLWAGADYADRSNGILLLLLAGIIVNAPAHVPYALLVARGRTDLIAKMHAAQLLPYILLAVFLTVRYGPLGAAAAWSIRLWLDASLLFAAARSSSKSAYSIGTNGIPFIGVVAAMVLTAIMIRTLPMHISVALLLLGSALGVYAVVVWRRVLEDPERAWFLEFATRRSG